jgi:transcriptional regulator with XRE-family HTH domain
MENIKLLKDIATITGIDISKQSRRREIVEIKAIFCNILRQQNFTLQNIGDTINMKHCSISHLLKVYEIISHLPHIRRIEKKLKLLNEGFDFKFLEYQNKIDELKLENDELKQKINLKNNDFFQKLFKLANENSFIYDKLVNFYNINSKLKF